MAKIEEKKVLKALPPDPKCRNCGSPRAQFGYGFGKYFLCGACWRKEEGRT